MERMEGERERGLDRDGEVERERLRERWRREKTEQRMVHFITTAWQHVIS